MTTREQLIFLDTEATGMTKSDRIIEIGITEVIDGKLTGNRLNTLVFTEQPIHWGAQKVHGIKAKDLIGKPRFSEISDDVLRFIGDSRAFAHNARFDAGMLAREWDDVGLRDDARPKIMCTLPIARSVVTGPVGIDALMTQLFPDMPKRGHHSAADDADILARVFLKLRELNPVAVNRFLQGGHTESSVSSEQKRSQREKQRLAKAARLLSVTTRTLNPGVEEAIRKANASGEIGDAIAVRVGRDYITHTPELEIRNMVGPEACRLAEALGETGHQVSALRMVARGMDLALAIGRQMCYVERDKLRTSPEDFSY